MDNDVAPGWSRRANHMSSFWRAVGGTLEITEEGILRFTPHGLDRALAAETWWAAPAAIAEVVAAPRGLHNLGFTRRQLRITRTGGEVDHFVVNKLEETAQGLRAWAAASRP